jgi:hypothetical protein
MFAELSNQPVLSIFFYIVGTIIGGGLAGIFLSKSVVKYLGITDEKIQEKIVDTCVYGGALMCMYLGLGVIAFYFRTSSRIVHSLPERCALPNNSFRKL